MYLFCEAGWALVVGSELDLMVKEEGEENTIYWGWT